MCRRSPFEPDYRLYPADSTAAKMRGATLGGKAGRHVGSGSALDDRSPALWNGLPGGLISRFERDGDVPARFEEEGISSRVSPTDTASTKARTPISAS